MELEDSNEQEQHLKLVQYLQVYEGFGQFPEARGKWRQSLLKTVQN